MVLARLCIVSIRNFSFLILLRYFVMSRVPKLQCSYIFLSVSWWWRKKKTTDYYTYSRSYNNNNNLNSFCSSGESHSEMRDLLSVMTAEIFYLCSFFIFFFIAHSFKWNKISSGFREVVLWFITSQSEKFVVIVFMRKENTIVTHNVHYLNYIYIWWHLNCYYHLNFFVATLLSEPFCI